MIRIGGRACLLKYCEFVLILLRKSPIFVIQIRHIVHAGQAWAVVYLLDRCLAIPLAWIDGSSHAFIIFSVLGGQMEQLENYVFHIP